MLGWPNLALKDHKMIESCRPDRIGWDRVTTGDPSSTCLFRTFLLVGTSASTFVWEKRSCSCVCIAQNNLRSYLLGDCFDIAGPYKAAYVPLGEDQAIRSSFLDQWKWQWIRIHLFFFMSESDRIVIHSLIWRFDRVRLVGARPLDMFSRVVSAEMHGVPCSGNGFASRRLESVDS